MAFSGNTYSLPAGANTAAAGQVVQSATWNSIHNDFSTAFNTVMANPLLVKAVNFNSATTDNPITVVLPTGYSRFRVAACYVTHASASLTAATAGLFTATGGGGTTIVTTATLTVNTASDNTNNNMMSFTVNNSGTQSYNVGSVPTLYFRVVAAEGSAATGDVSIAVTPFP